MSCTKRNDDIGDIEGVPDKDIEDIAKILTFAEQGDITQERPECWERYRKIRDSLDVVENYRGDDVFIHDKATIEGPVWIEDGAQIFPEALVEGPSYIGRNAVVGAQTIVRGKTLIGENSYVGSHTETARSLIGPETGIHHDCTIINSLIGRDCHINEKLVTGASRSDLTPVVPDPDIDHVDEIKKRGCIIQNNTTTHPVVITLPDTIIGKNCSIGSLVIVKEDINDEVSVYNNQDIIKSKNDNLDFRAPPPPDYPFKNR